MVDMSHRLSQGLAPLVWNHIIISCFPFESGTLHNKVPSPKPKLYIIILGYHFVRWRRQSPKPTLRLHIHQRYSHASSRLLLNRTVCRNNNNKQPRKHVLHHQSSSLLSWAVSPLLSRSKNTESETLERAPGTTQGTATTQDERSGLVCVGIVGRSQTSRTSVWLFRVHLHTQSVWKQAEFHRYPPTMLLLLVCRMPLLEAQHHPHQPLPFHHNNNSKSLGCSPLQQLLRMVKQPQHSDDHHNHYKEE